MLPAISAVSKSSFNTMILKTELRSRLRHLFLQGCMILKMRIKLRAYRYFGRTCIKKLGQICVTRTLRGAAHHLSYSHFINSLLFSQSNAHVPPHRLRWPYEQLCHSFLQLSGTTYSTNISVKQGSSSSSKQSAGPSSYLCMKKLPFLWSPIRGMMTALPHPRAL